MALLRLGIANPAANTPTVLAAVSSSYLVSVIAANTSALSSTSCQVTIYIQPSGATGSSQYGYIANSLTIGTGQSFETFRFSLNAGDSIYVTSTTATASFLAQGVLQSDDTGPGDYPLTFKNKDIRGSNNNTLYLEQGSTANRPSTATVGYVRYNTDFQALEVLTSTGWKTVSAS
jgi:hypothetical protein